MFFCFSLPLYLSTDSTFHSVYLFPTASWGSLNSFEYCFDGLPMNSVVAVCGMGNRKNINSYNQWCYGLRRLEEEKSPTLIMVYGEDIQVTGLHTPIKFGNDIQVVPVNKQVL